MNIELPIYNRYSAVNFLKPELFIAQILSLHLDTFDKHYRMAAVASQLVVGDVFHHTKEASPRHLRYPTTTPGTTVLEPK